MRLCAFLAIGLTLLPTVMSAQPRDDATLEAPRVMRYVSSTAQHRHHTCFGLVLSDNQGIPMQVRVLSDVYPQLCYRGVSQHPHPELIRLAFDAADAVFFEVKGTRVGLTLSRPLNKIGSQRSCCHPWLFRSLSWIRCKDSLSAWA